MRFTLEQVAHLLQGELEGNPKEEVYALSKIQEGTKGSMSFLSNPKYEAFLYTTEASVVLVSKSFEVKEAIKTNLIRVEDPYLAFTTILKEYQKFKEFSKVGVESPSFQSSSSKYGEGVYLGAFSYLGENVVLGDNVKIYPGVYLGDNVKVGSNTILFSGVKVYADGEIGENCKVHAGAVIGSDGFGFAPKADGSYESIPQVGKVVIGDFVDIGANVTIDRATMGETVIKDGVKLDNLIQIAHNVVIGKNTVVAAQAGISGSTIVGEGCMIGGQVGVVGHITIANKTKIGAQSGVSKSVKKEGVAIQGSPAFDYKSNLKSQVVFKNLPDLKGQIEKLEEKVLNLTRS